MSQVTLEGNTGQPSEYAIVSEVFDKLWYSFEYPDVNFDEIDPVEHYLMNGLRHLKQPLAAFDPAWYVRKHPEVEHSDLNPLVHYLTQGAASGFAPHPLFDPIWYAAQGKVRHPIPLIDYLDNEKNWSRSPHPLFDGAWYQQQNPDIVAHHLNPLRHFLQSGALEGRDPCPLFRTRWYFERHPELLEGCKNPLVDYVDRTDFEGRDPNPVFFSKWYLIVNGDVAEHGLNPLSHYVTSGWREGRNPSPYFDLAWYQARYPEVDYAGLDPLTHYFALGGMEAGYLTRPADRLTHDCDALDIPYEILRAPKRLENQDVCLYVCYAAEGKVEPYVVTSLKSLHEAGLLILLIIVTEGMNETISSELDFIDGILIRTNHGWDFAAWATALAVFPDVWQARLAILVNDSIYGPTHQDRLNAIIDICRSSTKDILALTDSHQVQHHLMSYFTAITYSGLRNQGVRDFWNSVRSNRDKSTVIREYEIRSIERWDATGVSWEVVFPCLSVEDLPINPTLTGWKELVKSGFPFIKVQLLRDFSSLVSFEEWADACDGNASLVPLILGDLERRRNCFVAPSRPVPSPKQRYIQSESLTTYYGATTSVRPSDETDLALEVPFHSISCDDLDVPEQVAVIAHIFYPELASDLLTRFLNIPTRADLFISTDSCAKKAAISQVFQIYKKGNVDIRVVPNRGRDIAPLLLSFVDVLSEYDFILHIHSKKSPHDTAFAGWCNFMLENLLGSRESIGSILHLLKTTDVGMVFSQHYWPVRHLLNYGYNFEMLRSLLGRCGVVMTQDLVLDFPSGSFFWMRSSVLKSMLALGLSWSDFPEEAGQVDGTLAHAIERSLLYLTEKSGHRWAKVSQPWQTPFDTLVPILSLEEVEEGLARIHRPLLNNRIPTPKDRHLVPELNRILARKDPGTRMRLTLLVPTLQPSKIFGGLTTALRFFEDLGNRFGQEVDLRIVSVSERVDLTSMVGHPSYQLLPISAVRDTYPRVVVDASEHQRGFLGVRKNEIFVATAWWTASSAYELQRDQLALHGRSHPIVYLIQDHEPHFYAWSTRYAEAEKTYTRGSDLIAVLNSEEFANYFVQRYDVPKSSVLPFAINPAIKSALIEKKRERTVVIYGRPSVDRNCFPMICQALRLWQRSNPISSSRWKIVSVGESYNIRQISQIKNVEIRGKLSLNEYGELLSSASVGVSLMMSPHPSYPPLEMAYAGIKTITNSFATKNLSHRSVNIVSIENVDAVSLANALSAAVDEAESVIGTVISPAPLSDIRCDVSTYNVSEMAAHLRSQLELYPVR